MSQNALMPHQGLRGTTAPYPQPLNLLPQTYPTNFMVPGFGLGNTGAKPSGKMMFVLTFLIGAAVGGVVCWKAAPYYHKIKRSFEEEF